MSDIDNLKKMYINKMLSDGMTFDEIVNELKRINLPLSQREAESISDIASKILSGRSDFLKKPKVSGIEDLTKLGEVKLNEASRIPLLSDPQGLASSVKQKPILGGFAESSGVKDYNVKNLENPFTLKGEPYTPPKNELAIIPQASKDLAVIPDNKTYGGMTSKELAVIPGNKTYGGMIDKLDNVFEKYKNLSDDVLAKMGTVGKKILENKYVSRGLPVVSGAMGLKDIHDSIKSADKGKYFDTATQALEGLSGVSLAAGAPVASGALAATSLGLRGGESIGRQEAEYDVGDTGLQSVPKEQVYKPQIQKQRDGTAPSQFLEQNPDYKKDGFKPHYKDLFRELMKNEPEQRAQKLYNQEPLISQNNESNKNSNLVSSLGKMFDFVIPSAGATEDTINREEYKQESPTPITADEVDSEETVENYTPNFEEIINYTKQSARKFGIPPSEALGRFQQESNFNPYAVSPKGLRGIGQSGFLAFVDAKREAPQETFGGIDKNLIMSKEGMLKYKDKLREEYDEIFNNINDENIKKQIDAGNAYARRIKKYYVKNPQDKREVNTRYIGGTNKDINKARAIGTTGVARNQTVDDYLDAVEKYSNEWEQNINDETKLKQMMEKIKPDFEKQLGSSLKRFRQPAYMPSDEMAESPIMNEKILQNPEMLAFLRSKNDKEKTEALGKILRYSPLKAEGEDFNKALESTKDLQDLYTQYNNAGQAPVEEPLAEQQSEDSQIDDMIDTAKMDAQQKASYMDMMRMAMKLGGEQVSSATMAKALAQIGAGGAGLATKSVPKADTSVFDESAKDSSKYKEFVSDTMKTDLFDPQSEKSKSYRKFLEKELKQMGEESDLSDLSFNELKDIADDIIRGQYRKESTRKQDEQKIDDFVTKETNRIKQTDLYKTSERIGETDEYLKKALNNPSAVGDIVALYKHISNLDPRSTVREGEVSLMQRALGLYDRLNLKLKDFTLKPRVLTPDIIKDIQEYNDLIKGSVQRRLKDEALTIEKQAKSRAKTAGLDIDVPAKLTGVVPFYQEPETMQTTTGSNKEVERAVGDKIAIFDANTRKFLRWKQ